MSVDLARNRDDIVKMESQLKEVTGKVVALELGVSKDVTAINVKLTGLTDQVRTLASRLWGITLLIIGAVITIILTRLL